MLATMVVILICIAIQRYLNIGNWFQQSWFTSYLKRLHPWLMKVNAGWGLLIIVTPILLALGLLNLLFLRRLFELFNLGLALLVLFCSMDARDLKKQPTDCVATDVTIFSKSFHNIFGVLFWFTIFGMYGAMTYFLITLVQNTALEVDSNFSNLTKLATKIQALLDWVPSRLLGFTFALAGHFTKGFNYCYSKWRTTDNDTFITEAGIAALDHEMIPNEPLDLAALDLIDRTLMVWIIATMLFTVGRWL